MESKTCSVCRQDCKSVVYVTNTSRHSLKMLSELVELMSGVLLDDVTSQLCRNCITRIESFDKHYTTAMRIKDELCAVIKTANAFMLIKVEPDIKEEQAVSYIDFAPNEDPTHLDDDNSFFNNEPKLDPDSSDELLGDLDYGDEPVRIPVKKKSGRPKKIKPEFYECPKCGKGFNQKYMLTKHLSVHDTVRKYSCVICGKGFKSSSNFKQHQRIHAKDRTIFVCDLCGSNFLSKVTLRHHLVGTHTNIRNFLCSHCPKAFGSISTLRVHAITHIEFKKECCDQCGARFHNKDKLRRHVRGVHSEERQFGCPICGQRFKQRYNVNAHMRTVHLKKKNKEKEFFCNLCGHKFDRQKKLTQHLENTHHVALQGDDGVTN